MSEPPEFPVLLEEPELEPLFPEFPELEFPEFGLEGPLLPDLESEEEDSPSEASAGGPPSLPSAEALPPLSSAPSPPEAATEASEPAASAFPSGEDPPTK